MIPLRHTLPLRTTPVVNRAIVIANGIIFIAQLFLGQRTETIINIFGFVPARLTHPAAYGYSTFEVAVTVVTSLFLHGGFVHLIGNMIYLWVIGGAVEEALGHVRYFIFFIVCGVIGSLTHTMFFPNSTVPSIGASGSIAGILGAFLVLRPGTPAVAKFLLDLGYNTGEFGKNHLGDHTASLPTAHGFQEYWGYLYHLDAMQQVSFPDINKNPTASGTKARSSWTTLPCRAAPPAATPSLPACIRCARA